MQQEVERGPRREFVAPPSLWWPERLVDSAWLDHAPIAFWLVAAQRPRVVVELGTHTGFSYFAFCQAIDRLDLPTSAYAVDTWRGDEQTGLYGDDVFEEVAAYNRRYTAFSRLVRSTFDGALDGFENGSIDLLHIDGLHLYESVRHDFEQWRPKLAEGAIVLLHDTNVRERSFGVHRLFREISPDAPSFEFLHGTDSGSSHPRGRRGRGSRFCSPRLEIRDSRSASAPPTRRSAQASSAS